MRYLISEAATAIVELPIGQTVQVQVYDLGTGLIVPLTASPQIAEELVDTDQSPNVGTGYYRWASTDITTQPTGYTEYLVVFTVAATQRRTSAKIVIGGYPDDAVPNPSLDVS